MPALKRPDESWVLVNYDCNTTSVYCSTTIAIPLASTIAIPLASTVIIPLASTVIIPRASSRSGRTSSSVKRARPSCQLRLKYHRHHTTSEEQ
eukprot:1492309-Rhodomonas_salina.1